MKNSRTDGLLVLELEGGYEVALDGQMERRTQVRCHDIDGASEASAYDIEQAIMSAIFDVQGRQPKNANAEAPEGIGDFYKTESPTAEEVAEEAANVEMIIKANRLVKASEFMALFNGVLQAKRIVTDSDAVIFPNSPIWKSLTRADKTKIVYSYCGFFANPLAQLSDTPTEAAESKQSEVSADESTR
jgi:hypothetical protein